MIPYCRVIKRFSHIRAYSLLDAEYKRVQYPIDVKRTIHVYFFLIRAHYISFLGTYSLLSAQRLSVEIQPHALNNPRVRY